MDKPKALDALRIQENGPQRMFLVRFDSIAKEKYPFCEQAWIAHIKNAYIQQGVGNQETS